MEGYAKRLVEEYIQLKDRYNKLCAFIYRYENGELNPLHVMCDIAFLKTQRGIMNAYIEILELRAKIENIALPEE